MKIVCTLSGGLDSTTLLWHLKQQEHTVKALSFNYGQRHVRELQAAARVCALAQVPHEVVDLTGVAAFIAGSSSQMRADVAVPEGHYEAESMKATVVPNRNMILLAVAAGHAVALGYEAVAYAAHAGDHAIYPDCREEFAQALAGAIALCDWSPVQLLRPFVSKTKADLVGMGAALGVPLGETWSCYKGGAVHCGLCGTCVERREAFVLAGIADPTQYQ